MSKKKIVFVAGGTAGHVFPALVMASKLQEETKAATSKDTTSLVFLDKRTQNLGLEVFSHQNRSILSIKRGRGLFGLGVFLLSLSFDVLKLLFVLRRKNTSAVVAFGGYCSLPVAFCAIVKRIPLLLHEQNALVGKANRLLLPFCQKIAVSFPKTEKSTPKKEVFTGLPIRKDFFEAHPSAHGGASKKDIHSTLEGFTLAVMGGSLGAKIFSTLVTEILKILPIEKRQRFKIIQQAKKEDIAELEATYQDLGLLANHIQLTPFIEDPAGVLQQADILLCRSGATSLLEAFSVGCPVITIPYPLSAEKHQDKNAAALEKMGGGFYFSQEKSSVSELAKTIAEKLSDFFDSPQKLSQLGQSADSLENRKKQTSATETFYELLRPFL